MDFPREARKKGLEKGDAHRLSVAAIIVKQRADALWLPSPVVTRPNPPCAPRQGWPRALVRSANPPPSYPELAKYAIESAGNGDVLKSFRLFKNSSVF